MKNDTGSKARKITTAIVSTLALSAMLALPTAQARDWTGNVNLLIGQKQLDDDDWQPVEDQFELGALFDIRKVDWPVSIAIDILGSADVHEEGANKDEGYTFEQHIGVRKIWDGTGSAFHPYIGGGVAIVSGKIKRKTGAITQEQDDSGTGFWLGAGTYWLVLPHLNLGLDIRYSQADVTLFNREREAGGVHTGLFVGYHW